MVYIYILPIGWLYITCIFRGYNPYIWRFKNHHFSWFWGPKVGIHHINLHSCHQTCFLFKHPCKIWFESWGVHNFWTVCQYSTNLVIQWPLLKEILPAHLTCTFNSCMVDLILSDALQAGWMCTRTAWVDTSVSGTAMIFVWKRHQKFRYLKCRLFWGGFSLTKALHTAYISEYLHFRYLKCLVKEGPEIIRKV